jgi:hypothetical protein
MRKMRPLPLSGGSLGGRGAAALFSAALLSGAADSAGFGDLVRAGKTSRFYQSDTPAECALQRGFRRV